MESYQRAIVEDLRARGMCGALVDSRNVCIKEAGHEPPCGSRPAGLNRERLLIALRNRRFSLEREHLHPERIKEITNIIEMVEAWEDTV